MERESMVSYQQKSHTPLRVSLSPSVSKDDDIGSLLTATICGSCQSGNTVFEAADEIIPAPPHEANQQY